MSTLQGMNVADARVAASMEVSGRDARRGGTVAEAGEVPLLTQTLRDTISRLDREFSILADKMGPILAPQYPANPADQARMKADSLIGDELAGMIYHVENLANAVVELRHRTKL